MSDEPTQRDTLRSILDAAERAASNSDAARIAAERAANAATEVVQERHDLRGALQTLTSRVETLTGKVEHMEVKLAEAISLKDVVAALDEKLARIDRRVGLLEKGDSVE